MASAISPPDPVVHRFGGVSVISDRLVPGLPQAPRTPEVLRLEHGPVPVAEGTCVHRWPGDFGLTLSRRLDGWCLASAEGPAVLVDREGGLLLCDPSTAGQELLVRQVLPRVLHLRGRFVLHGSAVATPSGALAVLGPSGAGKSTLAAFLRHHLGWPLLADDALVLDLRPERPVLHPTSTTARLWGDSAGWLGEAVQSARPLPRRPDKLDCSLGAAAESEGRPLHRVLILDVDSGPLTPAEAVVKLLQHQVRFHPGDPAGPARQVAMAADLVSRVSVERLCLPRDLARLPDVARSLAA